MAETLTQAELLKKTRITKLVMDGFKSFGKRTELLFGDEFNVILGPNGSGKSNVLDALCFVRDSDTCAAASSCTIGGRARSQACRT